MKHRFLIHSLNHTILIVDITDVGLPTQVYPHEGMRQSVPSIRFQSLRDAERYLVELRAERKLLDRAIEGLKETGIVVLTIT